MMNLFILIAIDILGLVAIWFLLRARQKRALGLDGILDGIRKEVRSLNIELNETSDRNISLIEDRMGALRELLAEADRRMGIMRREMERKTTEREVYTALGRPRIGAAPSQAAASKELPVAARSLEPEWTGETTGSADPPAMAEERNPAPIRLELSRGKPEFRTARESVIPPKPLREQAIELYRKGFSADIIAARVGATVAEIELLVSLEERRGSTEG